MAAAAEEFDRAAALKLFDETKSGVRGLMESGVTTIPSIFRRPATALPAAPVRSDLSIPTIDLSLPDALSADLIRSAAADWGFFQVTNHGIPLPAISSAISSARAFHELPTTERSRYYTRVTSPTGVSYFSNVDLFRAGAASWRDTLQVPMGPIRPDPDLIPDVCRSELLAWDEHAVGLGRRLMGLLSEGMGVGRGRLEELTCLEGRMAVCHYYPPCPEPEATEGLADHTDPGVMTVLIEDGVGGLQVKRRSNDGEVFWVDVKPVPGAIVINVGDFLQVKRRSDDGEVFWVDVKPVPGAIVINVGDFLQIISNDEYKSVEHRVVANSCQQARVSVTLFFNPGKRSESDLYGPLPELISSEKQPHYRNFTVLEFLRGFFNKGLVSKSLLDQFKLVEEDK